MSAPLTGGNRARRTTLVSLGLARDLSTPLHRQLYDQLREAILTGRLAPGARLPSTRSLASELNLSRNTVATAFEQLLSEGYVEGRVGAGTYVSPVLPEMLLGATGPGPPPSPGPGPAPGGCGPPARPPARAPPPPPPAAPTASTGRVPS